MSILIFKTIQRGDKTIQRGDKKIKGNMKLLFTFYNKTTV